MIDPAELKNRFVEMFGPGPRLFRAPGRVNLIGEHTDYNDGFVLPMAIDLEAAVAVRARGDRIIRAHTVNFDETAEFNLDKKTERKKGFWLNYIEGVARILARNGTKIGGADLLIWSDVPGGAGLSSSAALEVAVGFGMTAVAGAEIDRVMLAKAGQETEHEYVGANVGIMDQFVSAHARAGHALLLDCRSLEYENVPLDTSDVAVVIVDTNVKHELATSAYNERRAECDQAVEILKESLHGIRKLRDVSVVDFEKYEDKLPDPIRRRARHVITENDRTLKAAEALKARDLVAFGKLMWRSHESLKLDYEVSCRELDILVDIARDTPGVLGGRMTGGGFGGSTVNIVYRADCVAFTKKVEAEYRRSTGIEATVLISDPCDGASEITLV